ncbi:unnamed protein product [Adineta steineri]|uniref:Uncharacterized protein n=1 Tax=Adineta steineri TaxID=433720 RepID=A0A818KLE1_9BILA|nr:unnamed protein product [Adineta steineri]
MLFGPTTLSTAIGESIGSTVDHVRGNKLSQVKQSSTETASSHLEMTIFLRVFAGNSWNPASETIVLGSIFF